MGARVTELVESRELLRAWTWRIVRGRYQQSILGGLWAIVQPAATVAIVSVVFTKFVRVDTGGVPYALFSLVTVVPWTLLSASITDMVNSLVDNFNLVTKVYFPREVLPIATMIARLLDFSVAAGLVAILLVLYRPPAGAAGLLCLPLVLVIQLALTAGLGLAGAALNVFYRDVKHLVTLGLQVWLYASPVLYPASAVPESLRTLYVLNPMVGVIESYRAVLLYGRLPDASLIVSAVAAPLVLWVGYAAFKHVEARFADVV